MFQQMGKWMVVMGGVVAALGGVFYLLGRFGLTRLPGDLSLGGKNWRVYLPIGTCILLSILLTVVMFILSRLRR